MKKLHDEIMSILATADMKERIKTLGYDEIASTPEDFAAQAEERCRALERGGEAREVPMN